jgi:hypothetical protein
MEWLRVRVEDQGWPRHDPRLWQGIEHTFRESFADTLEAERAKAILRQGLKMKDGRIDKYVAKFEELVAQAGYDLDDGQTIEKFTNGLPVSLWETVYDLDEPTTYEQWRNATMKRQQKWLHRESVKRARHNLNNFRNDNRPANNVFAKFINPPHDPNAMDLSRGRA